MTELLAIEPAQAAEQAHTEIWRRFIDPYGIMIDFADLDGKVSLPTPEECQAGKPNALGWWSPIENGAMFNGLYLEAAVNRWQRTKSDEAARKARLFSLITFGIAVVTAIIGLILFSTGTFTSTTTL